MTPLKAWCSTKVGSDDRGARRVRELEAAMARADALTDGGRDDPAER
jgi:hypothetical protein